MTDDDWAPLHDKNLEYCAQKKDQHSAKNVPGRANVLIVLMGCQFRTVVSIALLKLPWISTSIHEADNNGGYDYECNR